MNANIEKGLRAYLADELDAEDLEIGTGDEAYTVLACSIGGKQVTLHRNVSADRMPPHLTTVVVAVSDVRRVVGTLHTCKVAFAIMTPCSVDGLTEEDHAAVKAAVRALFPEMPALIAKRAAAQGAEEIAATEAALEAGQALLDACSTFLAAESVGISGTSAWSVTGTRDGVGTDAVLKISQWQGFVDLTLAVEELAGS